jgi:hypothetical protein
MLPEKPQLEQGLWYLSTGVDRVKLLYDQTRWVLSWELIPIDDPLLAACWGQRIYRLLLTMLEPARAGEMTLMLRG